MSPMSPDCTGCQILEEKLDDLIDQLDALKAENARLRSESHNLGCHVKLERAGIEIGALKAENAKLRAVAEAACGFGVCLAPYAPAPALRSPCDCKGCKLAAALDDAMGETP